MQEMNSELLEAEGGSWTEWVVNKVNIIGKCLQNNYYS